jgi:hypothetical protein
MFTTLVSIVTGAVFSIAGKLMTKKLFEELLVKLLIKFLQHVSSLSTNTVDDEFVESIVKQLKSKTNS